MSTIQNITEKRTHSQPEGNQPILSVDAFQQLCIRKIANLEQQIADIQRVNPFLNNRVTLTRESQLTPSTQSGLLLFPMCLPPSISQQNPPAMPLPVQAYYLQPLPFVPMAQQSRLEQPNPKSTSSVQRRNNLKRKPDVLLDKPLSSQKNSRRALGTDLNTGLEKSHGFPPKPVSLPVQDQGDDALQAPEEAIDQELNLLIAQNKPIETLPHIESVFTLNLESIPSLEKKYIELKKLDQPLAATEVCGQVVEICGAMLKKYENFIKKDPGKSYPLYEELRAIQIKWSKMMEQLQEELNATIAMQLLDNEIAFLRQN